MKTSNLPGKHFIVLVILGLLVFSAGVYSVQVTVIQSPLPETAAPPATQTPTPAQTTTAEKVITIQFPSLTPETAVISQPDNVPKINKITYNDQVIFENGKLNEVRMDPSSGTLSVSYVPLKDATYYSIEIWVLTEAEAKEFNSWTVEKKNGLRQFQFILRQDQTEAASLHNVNELTLAGKIDQSKTKWYPDRNKERCIAKYVWIAAAYDGKSCET